MARGTPPKPAPNPWAKYKPGVVTHPPVPVKVAGGATKPPPKTVPKPPPVSFDPSNPATWGAGMGSSQLSDIVKSQIQNAINPQITGLQNEQQTYDQQQTAGQQSLTSYYAALAKALGGEAPAVSGAYNSAAQTIGQVGQGLTGQAGQAMQAENANAQAILARGGQGQAADYVGGKANPGASALNPFYSENALSPAEGLAGTGAARAAQAAAQPRIFANTGADALSLAIQKAVEGDSQFQQKIQDIYTQVPALRDKILQQVQDMENQQQTFAIQNRQLADTEQQLGLKDKTAQQDFSIKQANFKLAVKKEQDAIAKVNAQLQNSALDRQSRAALQAQRLNAQASLAATKSQYAKDLALFKKANGIGPGTSGTKPVTPTTKAKWVKLADLFYNGVQPKYRWGTNDHKWHPVKGTGTSGLDYPVALARLMAAGAPRAYAISLLNTYYTVPGDRGRGFKTSNPDGVTVQSPDGYDSSTLGRTG